MRSRSASSASNDSFSRFMRKNLGEKKFFNLQAIDGFAILDKGMAEEKPKVETAFFDKMDVDGICADIKEQNNEKYHLDKLFHPQGPYFTQTNQFEKNRKRREKRKNRRYSQHHSSFIDDIDRNLYKEEIEDEKDYCIDTLFEEPEERETRMELIKRNKMRRATKNAAVQTGEESIPLYPKEEEKGPPKNEDNTVVPKMIRRGSLTSKMDLLNKFKDHEVLNAFKLSLLHTDQDLEWASEEQFYQKVGENFISSLLKSSEKPSFDIERKLSEMNIQSDSYQDTSKISDFGDIIPVNFEVECPTVQRHQKWSIAEQKKLSNFIARRKLNQINQDEWGEISAKLNRTDTSIKQKAEEIAKKMTGVNKKRKVTDLHPMSTHHESMS